MKRTVLVTVTLALLAFGTGAALAHPAANGWSWVLGDVDSASVGEPAGTQNLDLGATSGGLTDVAVSGATFAATGSDGNFEFEHSLASGPVTALLSEDPAGDATPLAVGGADGQDVSALIARGNAGMTANIQDWRLGDRTVASIGPRGELTLGGIALVTVLRNSTVALEAVLPDGSTQLLVPRATS